MQIPSFADQPGVVRRLRRSIVVVGGTGVAAVALSAFGGGIMATAASAALSGGGAYGSGASRDDAVSGMAAGAPVEVGELTQAAPIEASPLQGAVGESAGPAVPAVVVEVAVTSPPVTTPPPPPPAPGTVQAVIAEVFGPHGNAAIGVARCESGLNPNAVSRGGGNWGLFQINRVHAGRVARMGYAWEDLLDARVNSIVAKSIFDESGWGPWACRHAAR